MPCVTDETLVDALGQCELKLVSLYNAMKNCPELIKILESKDFGKIERKQANTVSAGFAKGLDASGNGAAELDVSDREQKEEMAQQLNERNKLKHEALNRHEKKLKMKAKKPKTAIGQKRSAF